jgi:hypothetical protein
LVANEVIRHVVDLDLQEIKCADIEQYVLEELPRRHIVLKKRSQIVLSFMIKSVLI